MSRAAIATATAWMTLCVAGCKSASRDDVTPRSSHPQWALELREQTGSVPQVAPATLRPAQRPNTQPASERRGFPRDLTSRIQPESPAAAAAPSPRNAGRRDGPDEHVLIQLQTQPAPEDPEPAPIALSRLEELYNRNRGLSSPLRQFGYGQLARSESDTLAGPVPPDYVIGPDDELSIAISGSYVASHRAVVDRDGSVRLPDVGPIAVGGRTFRELDAVLTAAYAVDRRDFELSVGLGKLRRIRVQVIGHVATPGFVEVPAVGSAITALRACGGLEKTGSMRRIQLRRAGAAALTIDLYDFLLSGESEGIPMLRNGDLLFVPPIGATFAIHGSVPQQGIFELERALDLERALQLAGGTTAFAFTPRLQIETTQQGRGRQTLDVANDARGRTREIEDGDVVQVGEIGALRRAIVRLAGEVVRPGDYEHKDGLTVRSLLQLADGLTVDAHGSAIISRVVGSPAAIRLAHAGPPSSTRRRVLVVNLARAMDGDPAHDVALRPLDHVTVRHRSDEAEQPTVTVLGAVRSPGAFECTGALRVSELVAIAGGVTADVYYAEAELIRLRYDAEAAELDAQRFRFHLGEALEKPGSDVDPLLNNGDRLVVRTLRRNIVEVRIDGEVRFPGTYVFGAGARITDLIAACGGLLPHADLRLANFTRRSVAELQSRRIQHLSERTRRLHELALENMVQTGAPAEGLAAKIALENSKEVLRRIEQNAPTGRVVLPITRDDFPTSDFNLLLEEGDRLVIPRHQSTVSVLGHVFNPGSFVAEGGLTVADVVDWSGGLTEAGDEDRLYVIRGTGRVRSLAQSKDPLRLSTRLYPGDVVLVPRRPLERTLGARLADLIHVTRDLTEIAVLGNNIYSGGTLDVTAVIQNSIQDVLQASGQSLLRDGR